MPNHDFYCPSCKFFLRDQYRSIVEGGRSRLPSCPHCTYPMQWVIPRLRMDLRTDGEGASGQTFQKFHVRDGRNHLVEIDSTSKLRQVERESEQLARNGEGQIVRFRAWEQNHSNMSVNVFGDGPTEKPTDEGKRKFGRQAGFSTPDDPDCSYGPGVNDSNTSALGLDE